MPTRLIGSGLADTTKALSVDQFFEYLDRLTDEPTKVKIYATVSWVYRFHSVAGSVSVKFVRSR